MTTTRWRHLRQDFEDWLLLLGFQPEVRFRGLSGTRRWRWDYATAEDDPRKIAIEYNGIMGGAGRNASHLSVKNVLRDDEKMSQAALCGWLVLRVNAETISDGRAQAWIETALAQRRRTERVGAG